MICDFQLGHNKRIINVPNLLQACPLTAIKIEMLMWHLSPADLVSLLSFLTVFLYQVALMEFSELISM